MRAERSVLLATALLLSLLTLAPPAGASHEPIYKAGVDVLNAGSWEAHFVWLRSPYFNFLGEVWWRVLVVDEAEAVDVLFLDWDGFQAFREGEAFRPLEEPLEGVQTGSGWVSDLTSDLPYFLVLRNPGDSRVEVVWAIFAELDYRRWQGQEPGPVLDLDPVATSPPLAVHESWGMTFHEPGVYVVHTRPFVDNTGIVEVVPASAPGPPVDVGIRHGGFHPEVLRVPPGTVVRWANFDPSESTVQVDLLPGGLPNRAPQDSPLVGWPHLTGAAALSVLLVAWLRGSWPFRRGGSKRPPSPPAPRN